MSALKSILKVAKASRRKVVGTRSTKKRTSRRLTFSPAVRVHEYTRWLGGGSGVPQGGGIALGLGDFVQTTREPLAAEKPGPGKVDMEISWMSGPNRARALKRDMGVALYNKHSITHRKEMARTIKSRESCFATLRRDWRPAPSSEEEACAQAERLHQELYPAANSAARAPAKGKSRAHRTLSKCRRPAAALPSPAHGSSANAGCNSTSKRGRFAKRSQLRAADASAQSPQDDSANKRGRSPERVPSASDANRKHARSPSAGNRGRLAERSLAPSDAGSASSTETRAEPRRRSGARKRPRSAEMAPRVGKAKAKPSRIAVSSKRRRSARGPLAVNVKASGETSRRGGTRKRRRFTGSQGPGGKTRLQAARRAVANKLGRTASESSRTKSRGSGKASRRGGTKPGGRSA